MSKKKPMTERQQRRYYHDNLRALACRVVETISLIETTERRLSIPGSPYREMLGAIEEYYNSLADEFDDMPERTEPPLQSFGSAMLRVRELHLASCRDPLAPINPAQGIAGDTVHGRGRKEVRHA